MPNIKWQKLKMMPAQPWTLDSADEENPKSTISEDEEEIDLAVDDMDGASAVVHQAHWRLH